MLDIQKEDQNVADTRGRKLDDGYERHPTRCIDCDKNRVQVMGLWCQGCYTKKCGESRFNWADLTRQQFEAFAKDNAPA